MDDTRGDERDAETNARLAEAERRLMLAQGELERCRRLIVQLRQYLGSLAGRAR